MGVQVKYPPHLEHHTVVVDRQFDWYQQAPFCSIMTMVFSRIWYESHCFHCGLQGERSKVFQMRLSSMKA